MLPTSTRRADTLRSVTAPLMVLASMPPSVSVSMISTSPEIDFAAAIRPPFVMRTVPLIELADRSPLMSETLTDPEMVVMVSRVPGGAVTV